MSEIDSGHGRELDEAPAVEREPVTLEAVERDPMSAVTLALPRDADKDLLAAVMDASEDVLRRAELREKFSFSQSSKEHWGELAEAAFDRLDDAQIALSQIEAREIRDVWETPSPQLSDGLTESQKADLADAILSRMGDMHSNYDIDERDGGFALVRTFEIDDDGLRELGLPDEKEIGFADTREAMHEKIINRDGPFYIPELARAPELVADERLPRPEWDRALSDLAVELSDIHDRGWHTATLGSEHAARVVDVMLGAFVGYFVDEPTLTPQQVHDTVRANDELAESRAIEAAQIESDVALDRVNEGINHNRSPVHAGAGDVPHTPESIYDRYPGLTRDMEADTREQERSYERSL